MIGQKIRGDIVRVEIETNDLDLEKLRFNAIVVSFVQERPPFVLPPLPTPIPGPLAGEDVDEEEQSAGE